MRLLSWLVFTVGCLDNGGCVGGFPAAFEEKWAWARAGAAACAGGEVAALAGLVEVVSYLGGAESELPGELFAGPSVAEVTVGEIADCEVGEVVFADSCVAGSAVGDALELRPLSGWHRSAAAFGGLVGPVAPGGELFCAGGEDLLGTEQA